MDPISVGLLMALVGGAGGEMGQQAWASLSELVRRPFHRGAAARQADLANLGETELTVLEQARDDSTLAVALSRALALRAAGDPGFEADLQAWHDKARLVQIHTHDGAVHVESHDDVFHAPVVLGRDISGPIYLSGSSGVPPADAAVDRFDRALEQLGHDRPEVRLGGVHALAGIATVATERRPAIAQILATHVRSEAPRTGQQDDGTPAYMLPLLPPLKIRAPVVQEALSVLASGQFADLDLSHADLRRASLPNGYLAKQW